jgi:uncharacterized protein (TIRG00374 family)
VLIALLLGIRWAREPQRWSDLIDTFSRLNILFFLLALVIFMAGQVLVGFRWWLLLRSQDIHIGFWPAVKLHYLGLFYNNFMPSSVGGDLVRAWYVTKHSHRRFESALSVFVDRAIGLVSTFVIAGVFYFLFLRGRGLTQQMKGSGGGGGAVARLAQYKLYIILLLLCLLAALVAIALSASGRRMLRRTFTKALQLAAKLARKFRDAAVLYCKSPFTILAVFLLTLAMQMFTITGFYMLGRNLGIEAGIKYFFVFFTLTWVIGALPVSIGGAGVVEGSLYYLFVTFAEVAPAPAMGIALCQRAVWMIASLPGALVHISGAHLPRKLEELSTVVLDEGR